MKKIQSDLLSVNVSWFFEDLDLYDDQYGFPESVSFTVARLVTLIMAFFVHRAFYKLMKGHPDRAVNQIIYPHMVRYILLFTKPCGFMESKEWWRGTFWAFLVAYWNLVFIYSSSIWLKAFKVLFCRFINFFHFKGYVEYFSLGSALLMHNAFFIVLLAGLLGLSPERHSRRNRLLHNELLEEYGNFYNSTSIFFHGYFSLYLPFTWGFFIKDQSESYGELTADSSIRIMY